MVTTVNDLATRGHVTAALQPLMLVRLHPLPDMSRNFIVVSYIAIDEAGMRYVDSVGNIVFSEGQMVPESELEA